ncbi:MAG: FAD-dependent oxidoreductase, partial [Gemmatimonadota bacterium]
MTPPRALVLGAGVFGLTSALTLRRRGWDVDLVEPGPIPSPLASSTDRSKVIRADYGADETLSSLAQRAMEIWRMWNRERFTRPLFHPVGFLLLRRSPMEPGSFEHESFTSLERRGMAVERIDSETLRRRFPAWNSQHYPDGYLSREAGWAESGEVIRQLARDALAGGVRHLQDRASSLLERGGRVSGVRLESGRHRESEVVVLATGAWTPSLLRRSEAFR